MAAIQVSGVTKRYGALVALDRVDLLVRRGEFFGLLGPNGAGKTTLISIIAGLVRATAGHVAVMGHDVMRDYRLARLALGVVPQELAFDPFFTVRETLKFQSGYFGLTDNRAWIDEVLDNLGLTSRADSNMRALSGGMKRRVLVAQALVHKPPVIVLDEPTAGVDVELRQTLWAFVRRLNREGHTIVLTTHYLQEAQALCQRIAMLKSGRVIALDTTRALLSHIEGVQMILRARGAIPPSVLAHRIDERDGALVLRLAHAREVGRVLAECQAAGCEIEDVEVGRADLEDVFFQLMAERVESERIPALATA
ncbi:MAG: ABC transporter ATP-binding protein [Burkholderiaceae bacterium]